MTGSTSHPRLPKKCVGKKAAYMPATKWWCSFCVPTGGKCCWFVCRSLGDVKKSR